MVSPCFWMVSIALKDTLLPFFLEFWWLTFMKGLADNCPDICLSYTSISISLAIILVKSFPFCNWTCHYICYLTDIPHFWVYSFDYHNYCILMASPTSATIIQTLLSAISSVSRIISILSLFCILYFFPVEFLVCIGLYFLFYLLFCSAYSLMRLANQWYHLAFEWFLLH